MRVGVQRGAGFADEGRMASSGRLVLCCAALLCLLGLGPAAAGALASPLAPAAVHHAARAHHRRHRHRRLRHGRLRRRHVRHASAPTPDQAAPSVLRLRFGIYPWGAPGAESQVAAQLADDPAKALAAVKALQGGRSMVVHLYGQYTGADPTEADALLSDATWWSENGVSVEMVLRYRPASAALGAGYAPWVAAVSARLAAIPGVVAIQVGNEANNTGSAAAGDGAYPGAVQALASAIPAARQAVLAAGRPDIRIGFNWAAGWSPCTPDPMFAQLLRDGGSAFVNAVSFVGIDIYPGTWSDPSPSAFPTPALISGSVTSGLGCLRTIQMPAAGLSRAVTITVAETGWPTDASRSEQTQVAVLRSIIAAVRGVSATYGVSDLRWFDLRDANTASGQLENGYGLMHDDYSPKPAFAAYQEIIASSGA
jgi:hypothetical protein